MEAQAIIKQECEIPEGFTGTVLKGHTIVNLKDTLPPEYDYIRLKIEAECGGGMTNTGDAIICTDFGGRPLKGFHEVTSGHGKYSCGYVFVSATYVEIQVDRQGEEINAKITRIAPSFPNPDETEIWTYTGNEDFAVLPEKLEKYQEALEDAIRKSHCYHCHRLHFY